MNFKFTVIIILSIITFTSSCKKQPDRYIIFLHNKFLEQHTEDEVHPLYGKTEYTNVVNTFKDNGLKVVSEIRKGDIDVKEYAKKVVTQIDSLFSLGAKPNEITVVGTSKGGYIAQYVSTYAKNPDLNFVFIGSIRKGDAKNFPDINFCGNILNIYEATDTLGYSAAERVRNATCSTPHFKDVELNTGLKHGFLFRPIDAWIIPTVKWAKGNYSLK